MKIRSHARLVGLLLSLALISPLAHSGNNEVVVKVGEVSYVSGGVGEASRERLNEMAKDFNLKLVFALESGAYLSSVPVTISDASGKVLVQATTSGPIFLARLPASTYNVTATYGGKRVEHSMAVAQHKQEVFYFRWASE